MAKKKIETLTLLSVVEPSTDPNWRPPGWRDGADDPYAPEEGHLPENTEQSFAEFDASGYYTRGGLLTDKGREAKDSQTAEDVSWNRRALRDAWNTHPIVWQLAAKLIGTDFRVDPFWNQGAQSLPGLVRTLNGLTPETDGLAHLEGSHMPTNWRGDLPIGKAPAAVNGPHSVTEKWLTLCHAYGQEEFVAAFTPDNGDGWFQDIGMKAQIVVRLGRVPCGAPPGIKASSPRGASALLVWIPPAMRDLVPRHTQDVLAGKTYRVPMWTRARSGIQCAYVQPGAIDREIDFGLVA